MDKDACNLCGNTSFKLVYPGILISPSDYKISSFDLCEYPFVICNSCGLVRAQVDLDDQFYKLSHDEKYLDEEEGRRKTARQILKKIKKFTPGKYLLDIGCATGLLLDEARKSGYKAKGIELSHWAVNFARNKLGLDVVEGDINQSDITKEKFDIVILNDVLEHFQNPKSVLLKISSIIKPDGILYISTPDIKSVAHKLLKRKWWGLKEGHLFLFSKSVLNKILSDCGFRPLKYSTLTRYFSLDYIFSSIPGLNKLKDARLFKKLIVPVNSLDQIEVIARLK